jgi:hypothetical protein
MAPTKDGFGVVLQRIMGEGGGSLGRVAQGLRACECYDWSPSWSTLQNNLNERTCELCLGIYLQTRQGFYMYYRTSRSLSESNPLDNINLTEMLQ